MIREFSTHAKPTNNKAKVAFFVFIILAAIDMVAYALMRRLGVNKSGLVGVFVIVFITVAIYYYTRYVGAAYFYEVTFDSFGTPVFVVRQLTGKRSSTLCRINVADIRRAIHETPKEYKAHKTPFDYKKYNYVPTVYPNETYRLIIAGRHEKAEIIIECTAEFASMLLSYAEEARSISSEEDDDF